MPDWIVLIFIIGAVMLGAALHILYVKWANPPPNPESVTPVIVPPVETSVPIYKIDVPSVLRLGEYDIEMNIVPKKTRRKPATKENENGRTKETQRSGTTSVPSDAKRTTASRSNRSNG